MINPNEERMEYIYSYLGQSYLAVNEYKKAQIALSKAYELFHISREFENENVMKEYIKFLRAYREVLEKNGENKKSTEIENEILILNNHNRWKIWRENK